MSVSTVLPIWQAVQERFQKSVKALTEEELGLSLGSSTIGSLLRHNAEVEFMFAEWFFGKAMPAELKSGGGAGDSKQELTFAELLDLLAASNAHLIQAMQELSEEKWTQSMPSPAGASTPLEAIGRLIYHTGIHAGQISLIKKQAAGQTQTA